VTRALEAHLRLLAKLPVRTHLAEPAEKARGSDFIPRRLRSENPCERTLRNRAKREKRLAEQWV